MLVWLYVEYCDMMCVCAKIAYLLIMPIAHIYWLSYVGAVSYARQFTPIVH